MIEVEVELMLKYKKLYIIVVKVIDNQIRYIGDSKYILDIYLIVYNII